MKKMSLLVPVALMLLALPLMAFTCEARESEDCHTRITVWNRTNDDLCMEIISSASDIPWGSIRANRQVIKADAVTDYESPYRCIEYMTDGGEFVVVMVKQKALDEFPDDKLKRGRDYQTYLFKLSYLRSHVWTLSYPFPEEFIVVSA